jgi:hypothetical protein
VETDTLMLRNIPPRLKGKIARRVKTAGTNMNDVLVGILADRFEVEFQPTGVKRLSVGASSQALLTMPARLKLLIDDTARERRDTMNNVVLEILCDEFGIPFKPTGRWPKKAVAAT